MAPKGGGKGGGGGGGRGGSSSITCSASAYSDALAIVGLVLPIVSVLGFFFIWWLWATKKKSSEGVRTVLRWYSFGLAWMFYFIANVLAIVSSIMSECGSSGSETVYNLSVAIDWFTCLSWVFFLGTVLIPFCGYLYKVNGGNAASKVVKIVNFIVIGSFTVYTIATLAISTYIRSDSFDTDVDSWNAYRLINATNRLFAVFYTLLFLACCWAAALMFIPLFRMRSHGIVSGGLKFKIPAFAFIFALKSLLWCVYRWYYIISTGDITFSSRTGWFAVFTILEIIVYIQLINILSSPALSATKGNYNPMTAQAKGVGEPSYAQPAPQPYTAYDGAAGHHTQPHQPQPMYGAGPNSAQQWSTYAVQPGQQPAVQYAPNPHYR